MCMQMLLLALLPAFQQALPVLKISEDLRSFRINHSGNPNFRQLHCQIQGSECSYALQHLLLNPCISFSPAMK